MTGIVVATLAANARRLNTWSMILVSCGRILDDVQAALVYPGGDVYVRIRCVS
jgi:hypothetical protein